LNPDNGLAAMTFPAASTTRAAPGQLREDDQGAFAERLRRKLGVDAIETVRGRGYRLRAPTPGAS
jgi:hypothetical protein